MIAPPTLVWGAAQWRAVAIPIIVLLLALLVWGYWRAKSQAWVRIVGAALKLIAVIILALCLLEPLFSGTRARQGANLFVVLADNSQSMTLRDRDAAQTRAEQLKSITAKSAAAWLARIGQDFDLRQYGFDTQLHANIDLNALVFDGGASNLGAALQRIARQYRGRPLAGVMLLTDGTATDADTIDRVLTDAKASGASLPPIYPVLLGRDAPENDVNLQRITVTQTNFEDSPVALAAQVQTSGYAGQTLTAQLLDESGKKVDEQKVKVDKDGEPLTVRFRVRPEQSGLSFFRVRLDSGTESKEATLANNSRLVAVDRGNGPYRILYVAGRPNWEFKFLQRSLAGDDQVQLVGMIRIARREPKFNYLSRADERSNPLFRGFKDSDSEQVEQYDQPVLIRLGTQDQNELRGGFPQSAEDLYKYHAIIIDDLESDFFKQDQMLLLKEFVRQRGGGLLMLGGQESFKEGKYDRTPIGDLLPVYLNDVASLPAGARSQLQLTREGLLEPWVRLRSEEEAERVRLQGMPPFLTMNAVRGIKPGATVLASANVEGAGEAINVPALVEQRFGKGRTAAMLIGDLWRWTLKRQTDAADDLPKAWRQTIRWLVSEVPQRVEIAVTPRHEADDPDGLLSIAVRVRDPLYAPQDNSAVTVRVTAPDGKPVDLPAEASSREAGLYEAVYVPRAAGAYRAQATANAPDGSEIAKVQTGWTADPAADEFRDLRPNRELLDRIARETGGQMVEMTELQKFAETLPTRHADVTEPDIKSAWHQSWVFALAIACLAAEWGLRRWKGLPQLIMSMLARFILCVLLMPVASALADGTVIVVVGAGGSPEYEHEFSTWADRWAQAAKQGSARVIQIGRDDLPATNPAATQSSTQPATDKQRLADLLKAESTETAQPLWLVLIGHGTHDGRDTNFNLRGPDVSDKELADWLQSMRRPLAVIDCSSASSPFLNKLSGKNRVIITATRSGSEIQYSRFGDYISSSIADPAADLDKDGQTSLLEAFIAASHRTEEFYKQAGRLATEHALLDDNGDGLGIAADWFQGIRATHASRDGAPIDGVRAHQWCLVPSDAERQIPPDLRAKRDELELAIESLRQKKSKMSEADYYAQLEPQLLQLARLYQQMDSKK